jgi:hypothetical protein
MTKKHFKFSLLVFLLSGFYSENTLAQDPDPDPVVETVKSFNQGNQPKTAPVAPCPGCPPIDLKLKPAAPTDNTQVVNPRAMDTQPRFRPTPPPSSPTPKVTEVVKYKKGPQDKECQLMLGWGHTRQAKNLISGRGISGIGQGCNDRECGVGELKDKDEFWRYQAGTNGLYAHKYFQGTQNSGLNPLILEGLRHHKHSVSVKNSRLGFMRMTQYHWLKLHEYAMTKIKSDECSAVSIEFTCVASDMTNNELKSRLNAWQKKIESTENKKDLNLTQEDLSVLNRIRPLGTCFNDEKSSLPKSCGEKTEVTPGKELLPRCKAWLNMIDQRPEHNSDTPERLPKSQQEKFKANGPIY